ncbi:hypothetical protein ACH5RR_007798 [Cinchona calisaya]|uniref:Tetratricopeptide repeat-like superfamily protein n=1 Tax=Cinchona calisaya TaxID=153742 RepID=A0ABD3AC50_9GENT
MERERGYEKWTGREVDRSVGEGERGERVMRETSGVESDGKVTRRGLGCMRGEGEGERLQGGGLPKSKVVPTSLQQAAGMPLPLPATYAGSIGPKWKSAAAHPLFGFRLRCSGDSPSSSNSSPKPRRGFGPKPSIPPRQSSANTDKKPARTRMDDGGKSSMLPIRKSSSNRSNNIPNQAPVLSSQTDGKSGISPTDFQFEERLQAVKRSAIQQKKEEEEKRYEAIDYDTPIKPKGTTLGTGTKIGVAVATVLFGLVFAFGDFFPSENISPTEEATTAKKISSEEREILKKRLQQFEQLLSISKEDPTALEGAAVTLAELGDYDRAASLLEDLAKKKSSDPDVFRLLGEVKYELNDYEGSAQAYRTSAMVSKTIDFEVLRGLTNALLAAKKPGEAVQMLLPFREQLNKEKTVLSDKEADSSRMEESSQVDPIQVDLLLGKAYSDWGHVSDAVAVYDQVISSHPDDFRGYLAKGIILKENGNVGGAERMFIQARFFAPEKAKALVDKYSR